MGICYIFGALSQNLKMILNLKHKVYIKYFLLPSFNFPETNDQILII